MVRGYLLHLLKYNPLAYFQYNRLLCKGGDILVIFPMNFKLPAGNARRPPGGKDSLVLVLINQSSSSYTIGINFVQNHLFLSGS